MYQMAVMWLHETCLTAGRLLSGQSDILMMWRMLRVNAVNEKAHLAAGVPCARG